MKKRNFIILICIVLIIVILFFVFFNKNTAKNLKIGNNSSSQEIVDAILNINSYEAKIEVEVDSNKNKNKYIMKQKYKEQEFSEEEILEPENIAGVKISKSGNQLKIENTNLNLNSILENYKYVSDNVLDLNCFVKDYKEDQNASWEEKNNQIILKTSKNYEQKNLFIEKTTGKPEKLEIKWTNKNTGVYILYNEISINNL